MKDRRCRAPRELLPALLVVLASGCTSDGAPPSEDGGPRPRGPEAGAGGSGGRSSTGGTSATDGAATGGSAGGGEPDARAPETGGVTGTGGAATDAAADSGGGAGAVSCNGPGARFVTSVVAHAFGPGQSFGQDAFPAPLFGPPKGAGTGNGSLDVVSLGNGGTVTVAFEGNAIVDGPGPDFIVFENAFFVSGDPEQPFAELGTVAVSDDGDTWHEFPCTATAAPFGQCSGARPVFANADGNDLDPLDPAVAGGDAYDLADLGVPRARFVRITDRADLTGVSGVYDLDAVGIVHAACP